MWKLHVRVPFHPFAAKLKVRRLPEGLGDNGRCRNAPFLELHGVVHTAQRTGASTSQTRYGDIHLVRHLVDHLFGGRLGIV
ncbi:MAG: hypothetical protein J4N67_07805, partial [Chloroflexi bacterium]|nr:hypothetical protein [Chloroflexota bacterium]